MTAGRHNISENKDWCTPHKYVNAVKKVFGGKIDLDPCSSVYSVVQAETEFLLPDDDGLSKEWNYQTIYVNPPYGSDTVRGTTIRHWLQKISEAHKNYASEIIALIPVATNTSHWKKYVFPMAAAISFLYDTRLKFIIGGNKDTKGAPMACCCVYYGCNAFRFLEVFSEFGATISLEKISCPVDNQLRIDFGEKRVVTVKPRLIAG